MKQSERRCRVRRRTCSTKSYLQPQMYGRAVSSGPWLSDRAKGSGSRRGEYLFTAAVSAITIYEVVWDDASDTFNLVSVYHSSLFGKVQDVGIYRPRLSDSKARNMQQEYLVLSPTSNHVFLLADRAKEAGKFCLLRFDTNTLTLQQEYLVLSVKFCLLRPRIHI